MNTYSTKDIYIASTLIALGHQRYDLIKNGRIFYFEFDDDGKIPLEVDGYWAGNLLIDPKSLFTAWKELKTRMYENENKPYDKTTT
jgi:hypothetical protein